jgi:TRAP-type transport system small permease protein
MLSRFISFYCKLLDYTMALFLALMVMMVFGNVVLRYGFNSGITISEELSRWLFVWITFMGAVVALKEKGHLGTDMLIARIGLSGKKFCLGLSYVLMLALCGVLFKGAWEQTMINASFFSVGLMFAVLGGLIIARDLYRLLSGQMTEEEMMAVRESEDVPQASQAVHK